VVPVLGLIRRAVGGLGRQGRFAVTLVAAECLAG